MLSPFVYHLRKNMLRLWLREKSDFIEKAKEA